MSRADERLVEISELADALRAPCAVVVLNEAGEAHVVVATGPHSTQTPEALYDAGQRALYALSLFLEQLRPAAEHAAAQADRRAHSS